MFANTQDGGIDQASPDVCLTPPTPTPTPYSNSAQGKTYITNVTNILFAGATAHNIMATSAMTTGDEAGINMGTTSGTVKGPSKHTSGANKVLVNKSPVTHMSCPTMQNSTNATGSRTSPSQNKVQISTA
ncbi:PAAR-like domain-containing protein [Xenorhabdus bharatensis]|uniref:PAAR-like domain-containing protein n=1 Tax=Xenorhabdus bharatensis TaxID=3136256 RepID=UPI0030F41C01